MTWRFWEFKSNSPNSKPSAPLETAFSTIFSTSNRIGERMQTRELEEQRILLQSLAFLQSVLALLMPMVLHFAGGGVIWWSMPMLFALSFALCAWQLMWVRPLFIWLMVVLNVALVPLALFAWLAWASFSPQSVVIPFVLQMMIFLVLSLKPRELAFALWFCASLAMASILMANGKTLDQVAAILVLLIAMAVLGLVAQRLSNHQTRLGAIRQHVRKDSEKLVLRAEKMRRLALSDGLTGLANRLSLINKLQRILAEPDRASVSVLYLIDLDFFKTVNDQFGHAAGDAVLIECGKRFQSVVRRGDVVCRLGGDEFVIVVQGLVGVSQAQLVAKKILQKLTEPFLFDGQVMPLGGSVGVMPWQPDVTTTEKWLGEADAAMYQAKSAGRNQFYISRTAV
nr:diguanylate cyclase [uncultured Deefgea sp.]